MKIRYVEPFPARALAYVFSRYKENVLHVALTDKEKKRKCAETPIDQARSEFKRKFKAKGGILTREQDYVDTRYKIKLSANIEITLPHECSGQLDVLKHASNVNLLRGRLNEETLELYGEHSGKRENLRFVTGLSKRERTSICTSGVLDFLIRIPPKLADEEIYVVIERKTGVYPFELAQAYVYARIVHELTKKRTLAILAHDDPGDMILLYLIYDSKYVGTLEPHEYTDVLMKFVSNFPPANIDSYKLPKRKPKKRDYKSEDAYKRDLKRYENALTRYAHKLAYQTTLRITQVYLRSLYIGSNPIARIFKQTERPSFSLEKTPKLKLDQPIVQPIRERERARELVLLR